MWAAVAMGEVDLQEIDGLVALDTRFEPTGAGVATYDRLYREFPKLYRAQKSMFAHLNGGRSRTEALRPY